jgi:hypothetical protein
LVGGCVQRLGRQALADGRPNASVDRLGRAACELLEDDRTHECAEGTIRDDGISRTDLVDCDAQSS